MARKITARVGGGIRPVAGYFVERFERATISGRPSSYEDVGTLRTFVRSDLVVPRRTPQRRRHLKAARRANRILKSLEAINARQVSR
jgi:hypothetical protein